MSNQIQPTTEYFVLPMNKNVKPRGYYCQRAGLGVVGGFGKRPPGTKAQLKI
jgi:hypothetical protein